MATQVMAEMTGTVFEIAVAVGDRVARGDELLVIESMKMEIPVEAPAAGRIAAIPVEKGQAIEEGTVLVVLE